MKTQSNGFLTIKKEIEIGFTIALVSSIIFTVFYISTTTTLIKIG